jgi:hypothetical protein
MPVSSLIVGRIVDFDVDTDCALLELLAVNGSGTPRPVGHFSRRTSSNGTTRTTYAVSLDIARETDAPPTRFEGLFREAVVRWALWRLVEAEQPQARQPRRIEPRPHGAPVDDARARGPRVYRVVTLRGVAV